MIVTFARTTMKLELYFAPGACSFVPHFGLEAIKAATGQDFEPKMIKLHKGEQNAPEFKALNPNAQVPVLVADGNVLTQIVAICDFLDGSFPAAKLLPSDDWDRSQALSHLAWFNNSVHPTFTHFFMPAKFTADASAQAAIKAQAATDFRAHIERIQAMITETDAPFLGGAQPNLLDAYALTFYRWGGFTGIDPATIPALHAYVERLIATPHIAAVIDREHIPVHTFKAA
jgi:glutathione S-transferase